MQQKQNCFIKSAKGMCILKMFESGHVEVVSQTTVSSFQIRAESGCLRGKQRRNGAFITFSPFLSTRIAHYSNFVVIPSIILFVNHFTQINKVALVAIQTINTETKIATRAFVQPLRPSLITMGFLKLHTSCCFQLPCPFFWKHSAHILQ